MKQSIRAVKKPIQAYVTIPGSKSITNRALLLAALSDGVSELFNILISDDTRVFMKALHDLGCAILLDEESRSCIVAGASGLFPKKQATIKCGDAGTAGRFLLAACASTAGTYQFNGSPQLNARPILPLLRILTSQGVKVIPEDAQEMPFAILGNEG
jgi:3-phosphoshikimate 1-carboxyvinyltransferase